MSTDPKDLVLTCLKLYGEGDLDAVAPLLRDDYTDHGLPFQTSTKAEWIAAARKLPLAEMRIDIRLVVAEGDHVTMFSRRWRGLSSNRTVSGVKAGSRAVLPPLKVPMWVTSTHGDDL